MDKPRWPSPVRRRSRKPLVSDLGSSNLSLGAIFTTNCSRYGDSLKNYRTDRFWL